MIETPEKNKAEFQAFENDSDKMSNSLDIYSTKENDSINTPIIKSKKSKFFINIKCVKIM